MISDGKAADPQSRRPLYRADEREVRAQLISKLKTLARNPGTMSGIKPMAGEWSGFYRLRRGDLRVIYEPRSIQAASHSRSICSPGLHLNSGEIVEIGDPGSVLILGATLQVFTIKQNERPLSKIIDTFLCAHRAG